MQHIKLICVGRCGKGFYVDGVAEYAKRLAPLCRFEIAEVPEHRLDEKTAGAAEVEAALQKEGEKMLSLVPKGAWVAALCVEGESLSSPGLAQLLDRNALEGGSAAFLIGSSHGLSAGVKQAANLRMSLSSMTLPHQLARLVLAEQIYRALMIRAGSGYHK